jgi:hypothetical protein
MAQKSQIVFNNLLKGAANFCLMLLLVMKTHRTTQQKSHRVGGFYLGCRNQK